MSGFVLVFRRDGETIPPGPAMAMLSRIAHRGPDGCAHQASHNIFLGCHHFWTTPENVGERQPLPSTDGRYWLAFDGRLDNRSELIDALGMTRAAGVNASDAALVLAAYQRWRHAAWRRVVGPFACALYDGVEREVICARDGLGGRELCVYLDDRIFLAASEPQALLAHPAVTTQLDARTVAGLFTWTFPRTATLFRDIQNIEPGVTLCVGESRTMQRRFWSPKEVKPIPALSDEEFAEEYRRLIIEAVHCRLRVHGKSAVKLSGGLDSSAVAAIWAGTLANDGAAVPTYSWVFNRFPSCDERVYMDALSHQWKLNSRYVNCDEAWPLCEASRNAANPNQPDLELFRGLQERLHAHMASDGVRVALTGYHGDDLYLSDGLWLPSLLSEGRWRSAQQALRAETQPIPVALRQFGRATFNHVPFRRTLRNRRPHAASPWLTPGGRELLMMSQGEHGALDDSATARRARRLLNPRLAWFSNHAAYFDVQHKLEERHPFRDRRLVEFMLAIPSHQLRRAQADRFILRNAMRDHWPEQIAQRRDKTGLGPVAAFGLTVRERRLFMDLLQSGQPFWSRYVEPAWVTAALESANHRSGRGPELWVPWVCAAFTLWLNAVQPDDRCGTTHAEQRAAAHHSVGR